MYRFKSIDFIRGLSICWMIFGHLSEWWIHPDNYWYFEFIRSIGDFLGSGTFLFISGISSVISYRNRMKKAKSSQNYSVISVKMEYLVRAVLIFITALILNVFISFMYNDFSLIWNWFILQTISFSLLLGFPLLNLTKTVRILIGGLIWIINQWFLNILSPYQGVLSFEGLLFKIFYSNLELDPIFSFFTFFLIGTVIGDLIFETYKLNDSNKIKINLRRKILFPSYLAGIFLLIIGITFQFPDFLMHRSFSWLIYTLGLDLIFFSSLLMAEEKFLKEKSHKFFLFYFSYYSFSIYLAHNALYFLFFQILDWYIIWIIILLTIFILGLILRFIYHNFGAKFSLKFLIAKIASNLTYKLVKNIA